MAGPNDREAANQHDGSERRSRPHLREIFEQAYLVAYPMLSSEQSLSNPGSAHFLRVVLHDNFPNLHLQDVAILSVAIERVYRERCKEISP
ncbi:MAG: hypothetical protein HZB47_03000 [Nitrosomonadales bacterium]|nr:hypothetical protein [Nitrosomonadales bacterium]